MFGVASVASRCHQLETRMAEDERPPSALDRRDLADRWRRYRRQVSLLIGAERGRPVVIDRDELEAVLSATRTTVDRATFDRMRAWRHEPTARRLTRIAEQGRDLATRLGKPAPEVRIEDHGVRLDSARWAPFWTAFVHAVRNAVDHGLEPADERLAAGKPAAGALVLRTLVRDDAMVVELADDGRGIDWPAVARCAARLGLASDTDGQRCQARFVDGLSTRAGATESSGRGVGMSALRAAAEALGGTLALDSRPGAGTTLTFTIPHAIAFRSQRMPRLAAGA